MRVTTYSIPGGDAGIMRTVATMRRLVASALRDPLPVETAAHIYSTYCCDAERAQAVRDFLTEHIAFAPDPAGHELLRTPGYLLRQIHDRGFATGDCDDVATLGATLGMAMTLPARFVLLGFRPPPAPYSHIFTELLTPQGWAELDVTAPAQIPPGLRIHRVERIDL